jgi:predicted HicB family RNase H-like nuclease
MPEKQIMFNVRIPERMRRRWKQTAKQRGMVLSQLVIRAVEKECAVVESKPEQEEGRE